MTIDEAREYWSRRLEHAEAFSDEYMSAYMSEKERRIQADYIDALKHAVTALAICREREEAAKKPKTNGDRIRDMMNDHYIADVLFCAMYDECCDCPLNAIDGECTDGQTRLEWLKQEVQEDAGTDD